MVVGDAFRLRQVMDNLISNAIKYTREGGQVTVRARTEQGRIITTITDTGIGMSATEVARVFDPYFRADAARDTASGTGLGMGISRDLIQRQGGRLAVNSEFGVGTVVTVDLPAADETD
jgi:signal transduction histidine kinase